MPVETSEDRGSAIGLVGRASIGAPRRVDVWQAHRARIEVQDILDHTQLSEARRALLGPNSDELIGMICGLNLGKREKKVNSSTLATLTGLGWTNRTGSRLTGLGRLVADPIREYQLWLDRGRQSHAEGVHPLLSLQHYRGKTVLEPGSGFGCNLLSWSRVGGRFVGVEPVALYRQFTAIFAEREGLTAPEVVDASVEMLPFPDAEFDIVVCLSVLEYTDIRVAITEMARVLRPGGQLQIIGAPLTSFIRDAAKHFVRRHSFGALKWHVMSVVNTLGYQFLGRRLYVPAGGGSTAAPIYPTDAQMRKWVTDAGFSVHAGAQVNVSTDTCLIADKIG
jgi:SAM-dependent methyltransferase